MFCLFSERAFFHAKLRLATYNNKIIHLLIFINLPLLLSLLYNFNVKLYLKVKTSSRSEVCFASVFPLRRIDLCYFLSFYSL